MPLALYLMIAGIVPFVAGALILRTGWPLGVPASSIQHWFTLYGLVIGAFMAGTIWGRSDPAAPKERRLALVISNVVALALWAGAAALAGSAFDLLLSAAFAVLLGADLLLIEPAYPRAYRRGRIAVTAIVILCLLLHAAP